MFTGIDFTGYLDQIACDVITSMINSIQYLGKEYTPLTCPMGSTNAPLAATVTANSIVHHINNALVTQEMVEPRDLSDMKIGKATRTMTTRESWGNDSPLGMPGCKLLYEVIQRDIKVLDRRRSPGKKDKTRKETTRARQQTAEYRNEIGEAGTADRPHLETNPARV